MSTEFQKISELEKSHSITIGVVRNHANNFWYRKTVIGKILNLLTYVFIIVVIFVFVKYGFAKGVLATIGTGAYSVVVQKIATMYVRILLLKSEGLFDVAYEARSITIRNNSTGKILSYPTDWRTEIASL